MIYRQRVTFLDDFLLQVVFPWLVALHLTPFLGLARIWMEPVYPNRRHQPAKGRTVPEATRSRLAALQPWNFASSTDGTFHPAKREHSSVI